MTERVLLTGASGFVGSHVLRHILTNTDWEVVCPVTFKHKGLSDRIRLAMDDMPDAAERVTALRCDLTAPISSVTDDAFSHIDYVLNVASESHVDRSIEEPGEFIINNVALICNVLDWCRTRPDLKAIIQVSTDEVYGPAAPGQAHQEWKDQHLPSNPYSASKAAQEDIAFSYWRTYDLPIVITNTMNIIGETQDPEKFVPMVIQKVNDYGVITIHADENNVAGSRFYLHARNQADGLLHVLRHVLGAGRGSQYNESTGSRETLRYSYGGTRPFRFHIVGEREVKNDEMAQMIASAVGGLAGRHLELKYTNFHAARPGHDLRYALDGSRMEALGWTPPVPLEESLERTVQWTLEHPEWLL